MNSLKKIIDEAFELRQQLTPDSAATEIKQAVADVLAMLDCGELRVAEPVTDQWVVNQWIKKAVLLSFKLYENKPMQAGELGFYDKVAVKFHADDVEKIKQSGTRIVPPAVARYGSYLASNVVMMPSYVNVGAFVDSGTMIDTWYVGSVFIVTVASGCRGQL